jgi:hypothetical protein
VFWIAGAGVLLTDEAREVKLENGLLFAKILRYYDVSCLVHPIASLSLQASAGGTEWRDGDAGGGRE